MAGDQGRRPATTLELVLTGYLSIAAYVVFKTCEHRLSHWLGREP